MVKALERNLHIVRILAPVAPSTSPGHVHTSPGQTPPLKIRTKISNYSPGARSPQPCSCFPTLAHAYPFDAPHLLWLGPITKSTSPSLIKVTYAAFLLKKISFQVSGMNIILQLDKCAHFHLTDS